MRKTLLRVLIIGILILTPSLTSYANGPGTTTANFLKIGVGARATAMGEAFTALANDGTSLYWNPAGLIQMEKTELSATYNLWFQDIRQGYLGFGFPSLGGIVGLGANYVDMGEIEGRDEEGNPTENFRASDVHLFLGYAVRFKKIALGLTAGWVQDTIKDDVKTAFLGNIGLLYPLSEQLTLGAVVQNLGTQLGNDSLPLTLKMGIALSRETLTLAADIAKPQDNDVYWCLGAEWWIQDTIALRAGYKTNQDIGPGWSAGLGFIFQRTRLDYAYVPYGDLGDTHRISLGMNF